MDLSVLVGSDRCTMASALRVVNSNRKTAPDSKLLLKLVDSFVLSYSYAFTDTNVQLKPIKTRIKAPILLCYVLFCNGI